MPRTLAAIALVLAAAGALLSACGRAPDPPVDRDREQQVNRQNLFAEIQPVKLANCVFERIGDPHDGGYVICGNLLVRAESLYSYGISASDEWGCTLSARLKLPVHQYDCFNLDRPPCAGATPVFHEECVGPAKATEHGRPFDTLVSHIQRNNDAGKRLVMKMDVEGSEWPSLLEAPDSVLSQIDQFSVEFHGVDEARFVQTVRRMKRLFHVVNVHYNNWACDPAAAPLPALAFEILFVNKGLGTVDPEATPVVPNPLDAPNNHERPDCQAAPPAIESKPPR